MYYGTEHRRVLAYCAKCANRVLWEKATRYVDPEELMAEGWWECLRRQEPGDLRAAIRNTIAGMVKYAISFYVVHNGCLRAQRYFSPQGGDIIETVPDDRPAPDEWCALSED